MSAYIDAAEVDVEFGRYGKMVYRYGQAHSVTTYNGSKRYMAHKVLWSSISRNELNGLEKHWGVNRKRQYE